LWGRAPRGAVGRGGRAHLAQLGLGRRLCGQLGRQQHVAGRARRGLEGRLPRQAHRLRLGPCGGLQQDGARCHLFCCMGTGLRLNVALQGPHVSSNPPAAVHGTARPPPRSTRHAAGTGRPAAARRQSCSAATLTGTCCAAKAWPAAGAAPPCTGGTSGAAASGSVRARFAGASSPGPCALWRSFLSCARGQARRSCLQRAGPLHAGCRFSCRGRHFPLLVTTTA